MNAKNDTRFDTARSVEFLRHAFSHALHEASERLGSRDNSKGSVLYDYQVEFCYLIDEIERGPEFNAKKVIMKANDLIEQLENEGKNT